MAPRALEAEKPRDDDHKDPLKEEHDDGREVIFLREKIVEVVREGDAADTKHLLGLSVARRLVPSLEKSSRWTLLHFSCSRGYLDITRMLLEAGADPLTALDKRGKTCLHLAIEQDQLDTIALLLKRHPVGVWPRISQLTLGQTAARTGRTIATRLLLENGLDPNEEGCNGETSLHYAARYGHHEVIEVFLEYAADVGARERWAGRTPLHYACQGGSLKAAMTLIVNGRADPHICDLSEARHTPLEVAVMSGHRSLSHRLVILVENRRRDAERREATAEASKAAKREAVLHRANTVKRRVATLKGTVARKRALVRMEKHELIDNLRAQTARASVWLRNLQAQHERIEMRQSKTSSDGTRPGTCPAALGTTTHRPLAAGTRKVSSRLAPPHDEDIGLESHGLRLHRDGVHCRGAKGISADLSMLEASFENVQNTVVSTRDGRRQLGRQRDGDGESVCRRPLVPASWSNGQQQ